MPGGTLNVSPWVWEAGDYIGLTVRITVSFDVSTRALQSAVVHRDDGCQYRTIVLDDPGDSRKAKRLAAPADGAADNTYTAKQMSRQGLNTIEDVLAVQITAEP